MTDVGAALLAARLTSLASLSLPGCSRLTDGACQVRPPWLLLVVRGLFERWDVAVWLEWGL